MPRDLGDLYEAVTRLEEEIDKLGLDLFEDLPNDLRDRLLLAAASINDVIIWAHKTDDGSYVAREIESGVHGRGDSWRDAILDYLR